MTGPRREDFTVRIVTENADSDVRVIGDQVLDLSGASPGDVVVVDAQGNLTTAPGSGGSIAGGPVVRAFPFAFDTPGLANGVSLYVPTVGDVLVDGWFQIDTAWNGTTPNGDFGSFVGTTFGYIGNAFDVVNFSVADHATLGAGLQTAGHTSNAPLSLLGAAAGANLLGLRIAPAVFTATHPIKVVVSQDGQIGSAAPGSTQGAAILYLVTAAPL